MKTPEQVCMAYAELAVQIKECNRIIKFPCCPEESKPDSQCGDPGAPSCLTQFFANVQEARFSGREGNGFKEAREEVLGDMFMCDVCKAKLNAIELRKALKVKASGAMRSVEAVGCRLKAREAARVQALRTEES